MSSPSTPAPVKSSAPEIGRIVDRLFERLALMYGAKFLDQWRGLDLDKVRALWAKELSGFTVDEIAAGVAACRSKDWPPTLPEFMKACRPPLDPGLSWLQAQACARERDRGEVGFTDARLFEAFRRMAFEVRRGDYSAQIAELWAATLKHVDADIAAGQRFEITEPAKALPEPAPTSREEAQRRIAELRLRFGRDGRVEREPDEEPAQEGNEA